MSCEQGSVTHHSQFTIHKFFQISSASEKKNAISFAAFVASLTLIRREELAEAPAELTATG